MNYTDTTCNTERDNIKKCCLIAVDEITKEAFNVFGSLERYDYWQQVKEEINKL